jgi:hypothetical protein
MKSGAISLRKAAAKRLPIATSTPSHDGFSCWRRILASDVPGMKTSVAAGAALPVGNYVLIYRVAGSDVQVLRVVHGRRNLPALFGQ